MNNKHIPQSNLHFSHTSFSKATFDKIWTLWTNVSTWQEWDTGLKEASINSKFQLGAQGTIISLENRKSKFTVIEYSEGISYTIRTKLPFGGLNVKRYLVSDENGTTFTHEVWFDGPSKWLFGSLFGKKFRSMLPDVLNRIKEKVEK